MFLVTFYLLIRSACHLFLDNCLQWPPVSNDHIS